MIIGDIFMIRVLNQDIVVINSEKIAKDLLDRRSSIYSDRPFLAALDPCAVVNFRWCMSLTPASLGLAGPSTWGGLRMVTGGAHRGECFIRPSGPRLLSLIVQFSLKRPANLSWIFSENLTILSSIFNGQYCSVDRECTYVPTEEICLGLLQL